jgi:hypothetical protein
MCPVRTNRFWVGRINCSWSSPAQSFLDPSAQTLKNKYCSLDWWSGESSHNRLHFLRCILGIWYDTDPIDNRHGVLQYIYRCMHSLTQENVYWAFAYQDKGDAQTEEKNSVALSPQANYADWSTATCQLNLVPTLRIEGCRVVSAAGPQRSLISVF